MERDHIQHNQSDSNELTWQAQSAYSRDGGSIMPDGSSRPGPEELGLKPEDIKTPKEEAREQLLAMPVPKLLGEPGISNNEMQDRVNYKESYDIIAVDRAEKAGLLGQASWKGPNGEKNVEVVGFSRVEDGKIHLKIKIGDEVKEVAEDELVYPDEPRVSEAPRSEDSKEDKDPDGAPPSEDPGSVGDEQEKPRDPDFGPEKIHRAKNAMSPEQVADHLGGAKKRSQSGEKKEDSGSTGEVNEQKRSERERESSRSKEAALDPFLVELSSHLSKPDVKALLESVNPDFDQAGISEFDERYSEDIANFVKFIGKNVESGGGRRGSDLLTFANIVSANERINFEFNDNQVDLELSTTSRKILFEWAVEKIISVPDITPDSQYRLDIQAEGEKTALLQIAIKNFSEDPAFIHEIGALMETRKDFHDLRYALPNGEAYKKFLAELRTNGLHYASNRMAGVGQALRFHERLNSDKLSRVKMWFSSGDISHIDKQVEDRMWTLWREGGLTKEGRKLTKWEVKRAIQIANTFFNGTQRQAIYEGAGEVPGAGTSRIASTKNEFISRSLYPFKTAAIRYFASIPGSARLLDHFARRRGEQEDAKSGNKSKSIFGLKRGTVIANQMGAPDLRSHGWRNPIMHFTGIIINRGETDNISLLELLNENGANISEDTTFNPPEAKLNITPDVESSVLGQTLNLSALVGYDALPASMRAKLWQKRAIFNPSALVAFRPEIVKESEQEMWDKIAPHLDIAHSMWVDNEYETKYKGGMGMDQLRQEHGSFVSGINSGSYRHQIINQDYLQRNLSKPQLEFLKTVIDRGIVEAEYLSEAKLPHIYDLDDTPYVSWHTTEENGESIRGLDDPNMFRMFNDQANLQENGWAPFIPMFANLSKAKNFEWAPQSVEGLAAVLGLEKAQEWNEPMVLAVIDMLKAYKGALLVSEALRLAGRPRSEYEKFTGEKVFLDEEAIGNTLESLSAKSVISNDLSKGARNSRLHQLKWMMGGTELHKLKGKARGILQILLLLIPASIVMGIVKEAGEGAKKAQA